MLVGLVGLGKAERTINSIYLVSRAVELRDATVAGNPEHLQAVIDFVASGDLRIATEEIAFDEIPAGLNRLKADGVNGASSQCLPDACKSPEVCDVLRVRCRNDRKTPLSLNELVDMG